LITGANGFVGQHLSRRIVERFPDAQVVALVRTNASGPVAGLKTVQINIVDAVSVRRVVHATMPDTVIHLAAQSSVVDAQDAEDSTRRVNVFGSINLSNAVASLGIDSTFFFISSSEVYGRSLKNGPASELTPVAPLSIYAETKVEAEAALKVSLAGSRVRLVICRPFSHTGLGQNERFVLPSLAAQVARIERRLQNPVVTVGDTSVRREFLDVRDVIESYIGLIEQSDKLPMHNLFNIASGRSIQLLDILDILQNQSTVPFITESDPARFRVSDIPVAVGDGGKLSAFLGWHPKYSIAETVLSVLDACRDRLTAHDPISH
jgi:GDP-4-dehydro-6-deoxy-D-mannose reductase